MCATCFSNSVVISLFLTCVRLIHNTRHHTHIRSGRALYMNNKQAYFAKMNDRTDVDERTAHMVRSICFSGFFFHAYFSVHLAGMRVK